MARLNKIKQAPNWLVGLVFVALLTLGGYAAFTKNVPWGAGTTFDVVFDDAQQLRMNTPVRIAGVEVGKVTTIKPLSPDESPEELAQSDGVVPEAGQGDSLEPGATVATIEIQDAGLPLKEDSRFKLRPRLFLEGNLFVEVQPGSPGAPAVEADHVFPPTQTSNSVQLDEIFTSALQKDARADLQTFLDEFGTALIDEGGAESFQTLYKTSAGAFREGSKVNEAILGQNPNDLSGLIGNLDRVVRGLGENELALQDTISNLDTVTGSLAAQSADLEQTIVELPQVLDAADPAFASLNAAFPPLRAFSREILPGTRSAPETLRAATPLLVQTRRLSRPVELRGLVADLRLTIPPLTKLTKRTQPFLEQARELASCFNEVIIPFANDAPVGLNGYPHNTDTEVFKETGYGLVGLNGESRSQDANGQYIRVAGSGGTNTVAVESQETGEVLAGVTGIPIAGAMPGLNDSLKTPFKPEEPCENQEPPDLRANGGAPPAQSSQGGGEVGGLPVPDLPIPDLPVPVPTTGKAGKLMEESDEIFQGLYQAAGLRKVGEKREAKQAQKQAEKDTKQFYEKYGE
ncbi:MAG: MlaD family protein [Solirubrobacterales bacterium]